MTHAQKHSALTQAHTHPHSLRTTHKTPTRPKRRQRHKRLACQIINKSQRQSQPISVQHTLYTKDIQTQTQTNKPNTDQPHTDTPTHATLLAWFSCRRSFHLKVPVKVGRRHHQRRRRRQSAGYNATTNDDLRSSLSRVLCALREPTECAQKINICAKTGAQNTRPREDYKIVFNINKDIAARVVREFSRMRMRGNYAHPCWC